MEKLKQGKMDRKTYWIAMGILCLLIILLTINMSAKDPLGDSGRVTVGVIAVIILTVSSIMRLRDAGKGMIHLLAVFVLPGYLYYIGFYKSEEPHSAGELNEAEQMDREGRL